MELKNVFLMCGCPGSGKTTWVKKQIEVVGGVHVSRDVIRYSIIGEGDDYFSKENEVFAKFCSTIQEALEDKDGSSNIYIDATHLSEKARNRVLDRLDLTNVINLYAVNFDLPLEVCLAQNDLRSGREKVPHSAIRNMYFSYQSPSEYEKYKYKVLTISLRGEK